MYLNKKLTVQKISVLRQVTGPGVYSVFNCVGKFNEFNGYPVQSMHVNACRVVTRSDAITFG